MAIKGEPQKGERTGARTAAPKGARTWSAMALGFLRAHVIALSIIAAVVLVYALVGFLLVPRIARSQAQDYVTGTLHKKLSLGELRFNPFTFEASVAGMRLSENDGSPLVALRHLYVNAELASVWQRALVLAEVEISAPDVQLVVARDGSVNLARILPARAAPREKQAGPPRVRIGRLAVTQGRVGLEDRTRERPFTAAITPIRFELRDFRTDPGYRNAYSFAGTTTSGERLQWSGGFTVQPLGSSGVFRMQDVKLATIDSYLYESLPFKLSSGEAVLEGSYQFALEPFALDITLPQATIRNATLTERSGSPGKASGTPVTLPEVQARQLTFSFGKRDIGLRDLKVTDARVNLARQQDGTIDLMRLLAFHAAADNAGQPQTAAQPPPSGRSPGPNRAPGDWTLHIDRIQLQGASVLAEDHAVTPAARFALAPLDLTVEGWSTQPRALARFEANVAVNKAGRLAAHGDMQSEPLQARATLDLSGFELKALQPYLSQATAVILHTGTLSAKGEVSFAATPEEAPPVQFAGDVEVDGLRTTDQAADQDLVKWRRLTMSGIRLGLNPDRLSIDSLVAREPYASVIIARDRTLNIARALARSPADEHPSSGDEGQASENDAASTPRRSDAGKGERRAAASDSDAKNDSGSARTVNDGSGRPPAEKRHSGGTSKPFPVRLRSVRIVGGSANFADYSVEPSFASGILDLNGRIIGLSSERTSRAKVALVGKVDRYAPVDITGEVNVFSAAKYTDLAMNFRNMELTTFNPYSGKFAGYNIRRGKLSTELQYRLEDRKLQAEHHIVIDNLEFGDKTDSKDAAPIPIKLAVALLKDRNGVIDVNLPVSGNIDDPHFRLGPLIWKAALGLMKKVVTAPFAALGALFGGGNELSYVDFSPGSAELGNTERDKLTKLSTALVERPQLRLDVPLSVIGASDSQALASKALAARLGEDISKPPASESAKGERFERLEGVYEAVANAPPEYPADVKKNDSLDARLAYLHKELLEQLRPAQSELETLARRRAQAVQDALLANPALEPGRVFITSEAGAGSAEGDRVRMKLQLE